ncbi:MAG TPA: hypothetical protein VNZ26_27675, partial [Vicinamibacterales bacterium]|nr:hypothetical protein [Vicinamibacterales bacterium]
MRHSLHLLIVDEERGQACATWHETRWLLPILSVPERRRAGVLVLEWLHRRRLRGRVLGQWLGRPTTDLRGVDWLVVVRVLANGAGQAHEDLRWTPLRLLKSSRSWLDYQQWSLEKVMSKGESPAVGGPFGTTRWLEPIEGWIQEVTRRSVDYSRDRIIPYRVTPFEVVLGLERPEGVIYFKGLSSDRMLEATVLSKLALIVPHLFPRTLAFITTANGSIWWLMEECPGSALSNDPKEERAASAVVAYAHLQQQLAERVANRQLGEIEALDLSSMASWASNLLAVSPHDGEPGLDHAAIVAIDEAVQTVVAADVPRGIISD